MSALVKTKRQANFKDFKRFGDFGGFVEQKNIIFNSFVCKLGLFWHSRFKMAQSSNKLLFHFKKSLRSTKKCCNQLAVARSCFKQFINKLVY
jgi:hypothetical protein